MEGMAAALTQDEASIIDRIASATEAAAYSEHCRALDAQCKREARIEAACAEGARTVASITAGLLAAKGTTEAGTQVGAGFNVVAGSIGKMVRIYNPEGAAGRVASEFFATHVDVQIGIKTYTAAGGGQRKDPNA